jgi:large subunit ribosomal protein L25
LELIELTTQIRKTSGNGPARTLRRQGHIPAVLYGPGKDPVLLSVEKSAFEQVLKKGKASQILLSLIIKNGRNKKRTAMIKELQTTPVSRNYLHIDFYEVAMDRKIRVNVPVVPIGNAKGVEEGGILQVVRRELEVFCLPTNIPETFEIDITDLEIGDSVHVEDIPHDEDVEIPAEVNFTVITVSSPKVEEVEEPEEVEEGEEAEAEEGAEEAAEPEAEE